MDVGPARDQAVVHEELRGHDTRHTQLLSGYGAGSTEANPTGGDAPRIGHAGADRDTDRHEADRLWLTAGPDRAARTTGPLIGR